MADKKIISIEFKEDGGNAPSSPAQNPASPDSGDKNNPSQSVGDSNKLVEDILKKFQQDNLKQSDNLKEVLSEFNQTPPANQGPGDNGTWTFQNQGGNNSDPFGIFDTSSINTADLNATIDALNAEFDALSASSQAAAKAGQASAQASSGLAGASQAAANALGGGAGSGGGVVVAGAGGGAGGAIVGGAVGGGLVGAALAAGHALREAAEYTLNFNARVNDLTELIGNLSGEVAAAKAQSRVQEIQDRLRLARELGPEVARLENLRSENASEFRELRLQFIDAVLPVLELVGRGTQELITQVKTQLTVLNAIPEIINDVTGSNIELLDIVSPAAAAVLDILRFIQKDPKKVADLNTQLDELFGANAALIGNPDPNFRPDKGDPSP